MFIKTNLAKFLGKVSYLVLHNIFNGGTSFPGKLAVKIDHNILEELASDYEVILVTGTNGKTMTTSIITEALKEKYELLKEKAFTIIYGRDTVAGKLFDLILLGFILLSVFLTIFESIKTVDKHIHTLLVILEWMITIFFHFSLVRRSWRLTLI